MDVVIAADSDLRAALAEQFARLPEFAVIEVESAGEALTELRGRVVATLALGVEFDGAAELVEIARAEGFAGRIVALGGPQAGADEVLARPFRFARLLAALAGPQEPAEAAFEARLTEKERAILACLSRERGETVARETLLREVFGYAPDVETRTLETHIHRLRRKIEGAPGNPRRLLTDAGGYRLAGPK